MPDPKDDLVEKGIGYLSQLQDKNRYIKAVNPVLLIVGMNILTFAFLSPVLVMLFIDLGVPFLEKTYGVRLREVVTYYGIRFVPWCITIIANIVWLRIVLHEKQTRKAKLDTELDAKNAQIFSDASSRKIGFTECAETLEANTTEYKRALAENTSNSAIFPSPLSTTLGWFDHTTRWLWNALKFIVTVFGLWTVATLLVNFFVYLFGFSRPNFAYSWIYYATIVAVFIALASTVLIRNKYDGEKRDNLV